MTAPKLRFKEFSGNWETSPLKALCKINQGLQIAIENRFLEDGENRFFYITNEFLKEGSKKNYFIENPPKSVICDESDILMTRTGNTGQVVTDVKGAFHNNFFKIDFDRSIINRNFFIEFLKKDTTQHLILKYAGASTIPDLNHSDFYRIVMPITTIEEQTKIAAFLSAVDEKISQLSQKHQLLSQYKQGMMQKLFSQQIRFKADDGSEFEGWEETIFEKIGVFLKGKGISKADIVPDGKIPCIRYGELYTYYGEVISKIISSTNIEAKNLVLSKANDILIPASGETQIDIATASCVLQDNIALSGDLNIFRTKENGIFLSYLIRSKLKMQIAQLAQGNSVVHLYASQLKGVSFSLPCLEEQTKIANFLSAIDQKIDVVSEQLEQAKLWKKGLLQQMFV